MKLVVKIAVVLMTLPVLTGFRWSLYFGDVDWQKIDNVLREEYPAVRQLSVTQLRSMLKEQPLLIDVREADEYQVSHLPGAQLADTVRLEKVGRDRLIVAYCSVGLRSAEYVEHLQQQGFQQAFNLRGSIFSWANEGYPLEAAGRAATKVHPYNDRWGKLLRSELWYRDGVQ